MRGLGSRTSLAIIGILVSAALLVVAVRGVDVGAVRGALSNASIGWVVVAVVGVNIGLVGMAIRWRAASEALAAPDVLPSKQAFLETIVVSVAANNVLPARPGDVLRLYWSGRTTAAGIGRAAGVAVADRGCDVFVLTALLGVTFPIVPHERWVSALSFGAIAIVIVIAAVWRLAARKGAQFEHAAAQRSRIRASIGRFLGALGQIATPRRTLRMIGATAFLWASWSVGAWAAARALGLSLSIGQVVFLCAVVNLGIAIPSSPGFVGTYQWLVVSSLQLFDVPRDSAFAYSVLLHAAWFVPTTLVGLLLIPRSGLSIRDLASRARARRLESAA